MAKYRKKPVEIDAVQWFKMGDHPQVKNYESYLGSNLDKCKACGSILRAHGLVKTLEGDMRACPGDWIITGVQGEHYPCKPDIFAQTYEPVLE